MPVRFRALLALLASVVLGLGLTACGSDDIAIATRFWVSTCAVSRSVPSRKVTVSSRLPSPVDWLVK